MSVINKAIKYVVDSDYRFKVNVRLGLLNKMSDEEYLKRMFHAKMGYDLDLDNPRTFNEKLQWLKLYDRKAIYTTMVDKFAVKDYVASVIGEKYVVPTLSVYNTVEEIDFAALPMQFVLKCTHDSHGLVICPDKSKLDVKEAKEKLDQALKMDYFYRFREWPYKDVKPRIIAEEYLEDEIASENGLVDYKVHCFNGTPQIILVCRDRFAKNGMTEDFFSCEWEHLSIKRPDHDNSHETITAPSQLLKMIELSKKLSSGTLFLRVDWYIVHGELRFGELTFFPASGFKRFVPDSADKWLGDLLELSNSPKNL